MASLFIVSTPIGNLGDISHRALETLRSVAVIACEDTRVSKKLLSHYEISTPTTSLHAHSTEAEVERLIDRLRSGLDVALISDAGTPLVSDPGEALVQRAVDAGIDVVPIPGASAGLAAIAAAGVVSRYVLHLGFLPRSGNDRRELLSPLSHAPYTLVIYESPNRIRATLEDLARTLGDRTACVARELTKRFETFERGTLNELAARLNEPVRGEVVIVVGPAERGAGEGADPDTVRQEIARLLDAGERAADVAKTIAGAYGLARKAAYQMVLEVKTGR